MNNLGELTQESLTHLRGIAGNVDSKKNLSYKSQIDGVVMQPSALVNKSEKKVLKKKETTLKRKTALNRSNKKNKQDKFKIRLTHNSITGKTKNKH